MHTKKLWILLGVAGLAAGLYGQVSSRSSYQELKEENEQLHSQLAEIHSEVEDAQSELETLKSDIDDVQTYASQCDECDEVQSAASDLDGPAGNLESSLDTIETKSQE
jgi:predicted nuclease with TOPRIM domain